MNPSQQQQPQQQLNQAHFMDTQQIQPDHSLWPSNNVGDSNRYGHHVQIPSNFQPIQKVIFGVLVFKATVEFS